MLGRYTSLTNTHIHTVIYSYHKQELFVSLTSIDLDHVVDEGIDNTIDSVERAQA